MTDPYPRDLAGHGPVPPDPAFPGGARIAVQFVLNYEEGGERSILHGDAESEAFLSEIPAAVPIPGARHMSMESIYEYGTRVGVWRLLRLFRERRMPLTCFAVGMAAERHPAPIHAMLEDGHEIASHGWRWIDYQHVPLATERDHLRRAIAAHEKVCGVRPLGWYCGRTSPHTRRLVAEEGGFLYDADSYADELPYWDRTYANPVLVVPYTLDANDMRFSTVAGFGGPDQFFAYLRDAFDMLYAEGETMPRILSVGLHCRIAGRPARAAALARFLDHVAAHDRVWVCRRIDIAHHWTARFPP